MVLENLRRSVSATSDDSRKPAMAPTNSFSHNNDPSKCYASEIKLDASTILNLTPTSDDAANDLKPLHSQSTTVKSIEDLGMSKIDDHSSQITPFGVADQSLGGIPQVGMIETKPSSSIPRVLNSSTTDDKIFTKSLNISQGSSQLEGLKLGYTPEFDFYSTGGTGSSKARHLPATGMHLVQRNESRNSSQVNLGMNCTSSQECHPNFSDGKAGAEADCSTEGPCQIRETTLDLECSNQEETALPRSMSELDIQVEFGDSSQEEEENPLLFGRPGSSSGNISPAAKNLTAKQTIQEASGSELMPPKHSIESWDAQAERIRFFVEREMAKVGCHRRSD